MVMELCKEEIIYKRLYEKIPKEWENPVNDWTELVHRCHKNGIKFIPKKEPTKMGTVLNEEDFFTSSEEEVKCIRNLRYCPPFIHRLEFIKVIYVLSGQVVVYLNDIKYEMQSGNFCIVTPGIKHTVFSKQDEDSVINILMRISSFSNAFSGILMEQNILSDFFWRILYSKHSNRMLLFRCPSDPKLDRWVEKIFEESERESGASNLLMKSYALIFLGIVMREHLNQLQLLEELMDDVYVLPAIIQYIKNNLKTVTMDELTTKFGMNESELRHYIVRESGYTFNYLLRDLRLRKAVYLLRNTNMSVEKIIEEVGYYNITNFYRNFKKNFGKTPQEYREKEGILL